MFFKLQLLVEFDNCGEGSDTVRREKLWHLFLAYLPRGCRLDGYSAKATNAEILSLKLFFQIPVTSLSSCFFSHEVVTAPPYH